jgi:hypothetical protein
MELNIMTLVQDWGSSGWIVNVVMWTGDELTREDIRKDPTKADRLYVIGPFPTEEVADAFARTDLHESITRFMENMTDSHGGKYEIFDKNEMTMLDKLKGQVKN